MPYQRALCSIRHGSAVLHIYDDAMAEAVIRSMLTGTVKPTVEDKRKARPSSKSQSFTVEVGKQKQSKSQKQCQSQRQSQSHAVKEDEWFTSAP